MNELELFETEEAILLPEREALSLFNLSSVNAINAAVSAQTLTNRSLSVASAGQTIVVVQH
jgi:hypothetical protein